MQIVEKDAFWRAKVSNLMRDAVRVNSFKKKIGKYFNYGKKGHFAKKCRGLKTNTAKFKKPRKRPTAKTNTAESNKYKLLL
jgi:hypothetical protein